MTAQETAYVEFYASDQQAAIKYFTGRLGFTRVAESVRHGGRSLLLRQGQVQLIVTSGTEAGDFLQAHGDGIADIAFGCDNVAETRARAVAAGAELIGSPLGMPVFAGLAGVRHTLVDRLTEGKLPPGRTWSPTLEAPTPGAAAPAPGRIRLLDHVALCVESGTLAACVDSYGEAFGLARYSSEYIQVGEQAMDSIVVRSPAAGITFTILEPDADKKPGQVDGFLSRNGGPGVQHLAFLVDDIIAKVHDFTDRGIEFLPTPKAYYDRLAERLPDIPTDIVNLRETSVLADCDEWGYLLQLFTRSPYERNTMFYELVQRRGARGFGSANIKALYEAVERVESADNI